MSLDSVLKQKNLHFAQRIVRLYQFLTSEKRETVMSKQILRSGTSIGANIAEAIYGSSRRDFGAKRKEAAETLYLLELLHSCNYLSDKQHESLSQDCSELIAILTSTNKSLEET